MYSTVQDSTIFYKVVIHFSTLIAVGALESVTNVPAASYFTAGLEDCSKL